MMFRGVLPEGYMLTQLGGDRVFKGQIYLSPFISHSDVSVSWLSACSVSDEGDVTLETA